MTKNQNLFTPMAEFVTPDEIDAILRRNKVLLGDMVWGPDPTHSRFISARFQLADDEGLTIAGLIVELAYRHGLAEGDCKYDFTVFLLRDGKRRRAYQIEVVPVDRPAHNSQSGRTYGPHEHRGEQVVALPNFGIGCPDHERWFREFLHRANIGYGGLYSPPERQLTLI